MRNPFETEALTKSLEVWVAKAREVEIHKAGNAQGLIDWYNDGADGKIQWGEHGDFDDCVAIAGKYLDNPQGFCQLRHMDATGEPAGQAAGEVKKEEAGHEFRGNQHTGGIPGSGGGKDEGGGKGESGSKGGGDAPRQSDASRNTVSADRNQVTSDRNSTSTEKPKDEAAKTEETAKPEGEEKPKSDEAKKVWAQDQAQQILDGKNPLVAPDQLLTFFNQVKDLPIQFQDADASEIRTGTKGPSGLEVLGDEGLGEKVTGVGVPRVDMPQINGDEQKRQFIAELEKTGVTTTEERIDPNTLVPYQMELIAGKIGKLTSENPTGIPDSQRIIVSGDDPPVIIDGHHNAAAAIALHNGLASKPLIPVFRVKMTFKELLPLAKEFGVRMGNEGATTSSAAEEHRLKKAHSKSAEEATKMIMEMISIPARRAYARKKVKKGATGAVPRYEGETYDTSQPQPEMQSWANLGEGQKVPQSHAEKGDALARQALELWRDQRYESAGYTHEDAASAYRREAKITTDPHERASLEGKAKDQDNEAKAAHFTDQTGEAHSPTEIYKGDEQVDYTEVFSSKGGLPTDPDLYEQVKVDAKAKFDVYPSAVANGWVVQEYKRRGGKYRKPSKRN